MAVVDQTEQQRRASGLGAIFAVVLLAGILATPLLGLFAAFVVSGVMAVKAWVKSANRLTDMCIAIGGLIGYYGILIAFALLSDGRGQAASMVLSVGAFSLAWVWAFQARVGFYD